MREGGENDVKGIVTDIEGVQSLSGREISSSMRDEICVCVVVVVVVVVLMVPMGVVVLMVKLGIVVLVIVVRVLCIGVVGVVGILYIGVVGIYYKGAVEMDCARVVDILVLCGVSVVEVVEGLELVVGCIVRHVVTLVLWCVNERGYFCVALA